MTYPPLSTGYPQSKDPTYFLQKALEEAKKARNLEEVPIGAIIVDKQGNIIGRGHNLKEQSGQCTSHAELNAIQDATRNLGDWRLTGATLYSTLEPCPMCFGAILHARLAAVIFGAKDHKWGACGSKVSLHKETGFNHQVSVHYFPYKPCETQLTTFFKSLRKR